MSEYSPPNWTEPLPIYNPVNFATPQTTNGGGGGGSGYLNFPVAQGSQTMKNTLVQGTLQVSAGQSVNMGANIVQNAGTPVNPTDLATKAYVDLNAGTQNLTSVLTAGNTTGNFHISHADNYGDIYNGAGADSWVVACDPIQFTSTATNDLYLASNATDNFVRMGRYSGSNFTETARIGDLATGEKRAIFAGTLNALCIEDNAPAPSKGTSGQFLSCGTGGSLLWATAGGGGAGTLNATLALGNTATGTYAKINLNDSGLGGASNPIMTLNNTDTGTGSSALVFKKNSSTNGTAIGEISFIAKTAISGNPEREYGRIAGTIRNNASGNVDGSIAIQGRVNDVLTEFARFNGVDSENNFYLPLDMNGQDIKSSSGNMGISTASSTGTGNMTLVAKGALTTTAGTGLNNTMSAPLGTNVITGSSLSITASASGQFNIPAEFHTGLVSTSYSNQVYTSKYQPFLGSTPNSLPVAEFQRNGQEIMLINSKGDGNNELSAIDTPNFTITSFEWITYISAYVACGYNHIQLRPEVRCATTFADLYADIVGAPFNYIAFPAGSNPNGVIWCMRYDPVLFPTTLAIGGVFVAGTTDIYNNASATFPSNVLNFLCIDVASASIAPLDMNDPAQNPYTDIYGTNQAVYTIDTYASANIMGSGNCFLMGGNFTALKSNGGTDLPAGYCGAFIPVGGFTPLNFRWVVFFDANNIVYSITTYNANILVGGEFTAINVGGASGGNPRLAWCGDILTGQFAAVGGGGGPPAPFTPVSAVSCASKTIDNTTAGTFLAYFAELGSGSPVVYPVYSVNMADLNVYPPVLYKDDFPAPAVAMGANYNSVSTTRELGFIVGYTAGSPPTNSYIWDFQTPQYLDLNGAVGLYTTSYDNNTASTPPLLPYFCISPPYAIGGAKKLYYFDEVGDGSLEITTTIALPFVNAFAPVNKYTKITLANRNNFAMGTIANFGTDDVMIFVYVSNGATFSN